jgi:hypothetical protein
MSGEPQRHESMGQRLRRLLTGLCRRLSRCSALERGRTDLDEGRVPAPLVIEHLDVIKQLHHRLAAAVESIPQLALHGEKKTLHHGVVVAIAPAAHAADDGTRLKDGLIVPRWGDTSGGLYCLPEEG